MDIEKLQKHLRDFAKERDWEQYHTPKNLVMALSGEVGELTELFQWVSGEQSKSWPESVKEKEELWDEMADIAIYLVRLADLLDVDLEKACWKKVEKNARKYPVELSKGRATKYTELDS